MFIGSQRYVGLGLLHLTTGSSSLIPSKYMLTKVSDLIQNQIPPGSFTLDLLSGSGQT
jgi:hypothetical protein